MNAIYGILIAIGLLAIWVMLMSRGALKDIWNYHFKQWDKENRK